jgi:taurine dioxygenase
MRGPACEEDTEMTNIVQVNRIGGHIGAEIQGVDLRRPLSEDQFDTVRAALDDHHVIFFRDQDLTGDQQLAFAARFGEIGSETPVRGSEDITFIEDTAENPPHTDQWHTDHSCFAEPPGIAFLASVDIPAYGGDTVWVSLMAIHGALSPTLRSFVEQLEMRHGVVGQYRAAIERHLALEGVPPHEIHERLERAAATQSAVHPLVRTHPRSGRQAVYLSPRFSDGIVGLDPSESAALLALLEAHLENPNFQVRWHWRPHDLAVWDEAATNHRALADHFATEPQYRRMRRCTVRGSKPFFSAEGNGLLANGCG